MAPKGKQSAVLKAAEQPTGSGKGGRGGRGKGSKGSKAPAGGAAPSTSGASSGISTAQGLLGEVLWKQQRVGKQAQVSGATVDATLRRRLDQASLAARSVTRAGGEEHVTNPLGAIMALAVSLDAAAREGEAAHRVEAAARMVQQRLIALAEAVPQLGSGTGGAPLVAELKAVRSGKQP